MECTYKIPNVNISFNVLKNNEMKTLIVFLCFFSVIVSAQEESQFKIKDNLLKVSLFHNLTISENLTLQNGVSVKKTFGFVTFETPIILKYDLSNRWSTFIGVQSRTVIHSYFPDDLSFPEPSKSFLSIGTDYEFIDNTTGNLSIGFPLDLQLGLKF